MNKCVFAWLGLAMMAVGAAAQTTMPASGAATAGSVPSSAPFVCAESFFTAAMAGDYGQAINAADQAQSLTSPSTLKICDPGNHPVNTQIVFDRPIHFDATGSKLIPGNNLASTPVSVSNATVTAGSKIIAVSSTSSMAPGQAVGGLGITEGSYITAIDSGTITVSLMPSLVVNGFINGTTTVYTSNSLVGLAAGQAVTGYGIPASTTITAVTTTEPQSITLSNAATTTLNTSVALTVSSGTWTVPTLTAVKTTPVITWGWNSDALQNEFGQMIGGSMSNVWIFNGASNQALRTYTGLQGIQIYGWDGFDAYNTRIEGITGQGLVLGGNIPSSTKGQGGPVRESFFYDTKIRYSGDYATGQPAMSIITPYGNGDESNQIEFSGGQLVTNLAENLTIGTYNPTHTENNGPRLLWFDNNFQIEGGSYLTSAPPAIAQTDSVHIIQGDDSYFTGDELNGSGFGKALVRIDTAANVKITGSRLMDSAIEIAYTVSVSHNSPIVTWSSGGNGMFLTGNSWDGIAAWLVDATECPSGCIVHLLARNAVTGSRSLTLANNYTGTSSTATLTLPYGGYVVNVTNVIYQSLDTLTDAVYAADATTYKALSGGQTAYAVSSSSMYVGGGANIPGMQTWANRGLQNINGFFANSMYDYPYLPTSSFLAGNLSTGHCTQNFIGKNQANYNSFVDGFCLADGAGSSSNYYYLQPYGSPNFYFFRGNGTFSAPTITSSAIYSTAPGCGSSAPYLEYNGTCGAGNLSHGDATLSSGAAAVNTSAACRPSSTCVYRLTNCGTNSSKAIGILTIGAVTPGISFVINSESTAVALVKADNSQVCWQIN